MNKPQLTLTAIAILALAFAFLARRTPFSTAEALAKHSYSQQGEDLIIANIFDYLGTPVRRYLDVGAWEPIADSNTYLFYRRGARGVLVEPNPHYVRKLRTARPGDTVLAVGIGIGAETEAPYFLVDDGSTGLNTFSAEQAAKLADQGRRLRETRMPLRPLDEVFREHFEAPGLPLDLLSIDVEGLDLAILKTMDFERFRPRVICAETKEVDSHDQVGDLIEFIRSRGYVLRGATFVNSIFIDERLLRSTDR